jgi:hypothetical protein
VSSAIVYDSGELAPAVAQIGRDRLNCALDDAVPAFGAQVHTLANGQVLSVVPCHFGDVNIESFVVIANGAGGGDARLVRFQRPLGEDPEPRGTIINPRWEPSVRRLTSTRYDSPNSDCGTFEIHEPMPGTAGFELVQVRQKAQCDGSATPAENYPLAWSIEEMGR